MARPGANEEIVSVINKRLELLQALSEPRSKRDLVDHLDLSRSTANRAVRQLESLGLVTRSGKYRLTPAGRLVVTVFTEFTSDLAEVVHIEGLLGTMPPDAPIDMAFVRGAEVNWSTGPTPTEPVSNALKHYEDATRIRLLMPRVTRPDVPETICEHVTGQEVPASLVLSAALVEHLREREIGWLDDLADADGCTLRVAETLPYALGVFDQSDGLHVGIVVYDGDGNVQGFVENDTLKAYGWGSLVFREFFEAATPLCEF